MHKRIYYFLYDELENKTYKIHNGENIILHIIKGNKSYLTAPKCGTRADIVYIDGRLNTKEYQEWINTCIKPMLTYKNSAPTICYI